MCICEDKETFVIGEILAEYEKALIKHPGWPDDIVHAVAVMVEEAGESMQAALDCYYSGGDKNHLKTELAQTGAMCIRALVNL